MRIIHLDPTATDPADVVRGLRFRPDGKAFAATFGPVRAASDVFWWDLAADRVAGRVGVEDDEEEHRDEYPDPALGPDLEVVAWTSADVYGEYESVRLIDTWAKPRQVVEAPPQELAALQCLAFEPAGETLYAGGLAGEHAQPTVFRWDVEPLFGRDPWEGDGGDGGDAELAPLFLPRGAGTPTCLAVAPGGRMVAVGSNDGRVDLFDPARPDLGSRILEIVQWDTPRDVRGVRFAPDGLRLAAWHQGGVTVWHVPSGNRAADGTWDWHHPPTDVAFRPDGRALAVAALDGTVRFLDPVTLADLRRFEWGVGGLHGVAFAPDGLTCAAGGEQGRVVLWDVDG